MVMCHIASYVKSFMGEKFCYFCMWLYENRESVSMNY